VVLIVSLWLSGGAINDYRLGLSSVEGYRVTGRGTGIFGNPNDMALHLVTVLPIVAALFFVRQGPLKKLTFGMCALLMVAGIVLAYPRGAASGLVVSMCFLAWRIGRKRRLAVVFWVTVFV